MNKTNIIIIMKVDSFKLVDFTVPTVSCCPVSQNHHSSIVADTAAKGKDGRNLKLHYCTHSLTAHSITKLYASTRTTLHGGTR